MKKAAQSNRLKLSWNDVGFLSEGLSFATRPVWIATEKITHKYSLGRRGAWILILISEGAVVHPLDVTKAFRINRSLITAELTRLVTAQLITYRKSKDDRRRVELALTLLGDKAARQVRDELSRVLAERLSAYTRTEILLCARMLHDLILPEAEQIRWRQRDK